jgi:Uma2 family endonuclease
MTYTLDTEDDAPKLRFSASDVPRMVAAGVLDPDLRYEIIEGEIVPVQAHNPPHMRIKRYILRELNAQLGKSVWVDSESTLYLEVDGDYTLPDILVYPNEYQAHDVRGKDVLLIVEVADSTFKKDRTRKAALYAKHGVREFWLVNALTLKSYVFRDPQKGGYASEREINETEPLEVLLLPNVSVRVGDA